MYGYIYKTTNLINNKIYIGQHKSESFDEQYIGSGSMLQDAIIKYGANNFRCEVLEECSSKEELNEKEIFYIKKYNSMDRNLGYNIAPGGCGGDILQFLSDEQRVKRAKKISNSLVGHEISEETRVKISNALKKCWKDNYDEKSAINKRSMTDIKRLNMSKGIKKIYEDNPQLRTKVSERQRERWDTDEYRNKQHMSRSSSKYKKLMTEKLSGKTLGYVTMNNNNIQKRVPPDEVDRFLALGWKKGCLPFSEETKRRMSESAKRRPTTGNAVPIECVTTGEHFSSKKEASKKIGVSIYMIDKSINTNEPVDGLLFRISERG